MQTIFWQFKFKPILVLKFNKLMMFNMGVGTFFLLIFNNNNLIVIFTLKHLDSLKTKELQTNFHK